MNYLVEVFITRRYTVHVEAPDELAAKREAIVEDPHCLLEDEDYGGLRRVGAVELEDPDDLGVTTEREGGGGL